MVMRYFYDHQTDALSFTLTESLDYAGCEEIAPGVTLYVDRRRKPIAFDVRDASKLIDTRGLLPMQERPIDDGEVSQRMSSTDSGQLVWRNVVRRTLVPAVAV